MKADLYNEENKLIYSWEKLIKDKYLTVRDNYINACSEYLSGKLVISDKIIGIDSFAFNNCKLLTEIIIPENITKIGSWCFGNCINLKNINLPNSLTIIGDHAFLSCMQLTKIQMPQNLEKIYSSAFKYCSNLKEVKLNRNIKLIDLNAFGDCERLTKIIYPGPESEFKEIGGWEHILDRNKLTINNIKFQKTLEDLIKEGYTLTEANRELKQQKEDMIK